MSSASCSTESIKNNTVQKGHEFLKQFFALYKSEPLLWRTTRTKKSDEFEKDRAWTELTNVYREVYPSATVDAVKNEMSNFKKQIQAEYKRRNEKQEPNPRIWYYNDLLFLVSSEPVDNQAADNSGQSNDDVKGETSTPQKATKGKSTPNQKIKKVIVTKETVAEDRPDELTQKFRSMSFEEFSIVENIFANIFELVKLKHEGSVAQEVKPKSK